MQTPKCGRKTTATSRFSGSSAEQDGEELHAVFNFSDYPKTVWMPEKAEYTNLLSGGTDELATVDLPGWGFFWMKKKL